MPKQPLSSAIALLKHYAALFGESRPKAVLLSLVIALTEAVGSLAPRRLAQP